MSEQTERDLYEAYVVHYPDGGWLAELSDFPGAYATGATQAEALARLAAAAPGYYAWLSVHDEYTPTTHATAEVVAREVVEAPAGAMSAFFTDDAETVSDEDMDWLLAVLGWALDDLEAQAQRAAPSARRDALLVAVARAQARLVALVTGAPLPAITPADALAQVKATHAAALTAFRRTRPEQRATVREMDGQRWSVRRGLRESALLARRSTDELATLG
ncbi:MAG: hypothetical protein KGO05_15280 [Chloroflexota bacterium]|nr:hypothetical protein [Chloroflexota bacterium]